MPKLGGIESAQPKGPNKRLPTDILGRQQSTSQIMTELYELSLFSQPPANSISYCIRQDYCSKPIRLSQSRQELLTPCIGHRIPSENLPEDALVF